MNVRPLPGPAGLLFLFSTALAGVLPAQGEEAALEKYKKYIVRLPFRYHCDAREELARTRSANALAVLLADYASPKDVASNRLGLAEVHDYARYTLAAMFGRYFGHWSWEDQLGKLRAAHKSPADVWLWVHTLATDDREQGAAAALEVAKDAGNPLLQAAALAAMARRGRSQALSVVPAVCEQLGKSKKAGERRLLIGALSDVILANRAVLADDAMQKAIRAYINLLHKDVKLTDSAKMVIARHLALTIGKDRRYIEPEPWIQLLDQGFEPPKTAGYTVTKPRFFGIEAEGDRICYLIDMSNSMLKPIAQELLPKGPITGKKRKRKRGDLPTEDDIPWHLVKTRFDLAREHLKISLRRLAKDKRFCVVWFGDESGLLKSTPGMIKASRSSVARVIKELDSIKPGPLPPGRQQRDAPHGWLRGQTNMHGGIRRAFSLRAKGFAPRHEFVDLKALAEGCDAIFLLSDGAPSTDDFVIRDKDYGDGRVVAELEYKREVARPPFLIHHGPMDMPRWLREDIRRMNAFRKAQIHCITIGEADLRLMEGIASDSGGQVYQFGAKRR